MLCFRHTKETSNNLANTAFNNIFYFVSVINLSLCKRISCLTIKGAIIIHVKFRGARILKILRCFRILHVQILSGFKNWDIQDLTLRRCDTLKSCRWNFFKFSWVVHYSWEKQETTTLKRPKILQKLNKGDCFCLHYWFHFFMALLAQKLIDTTNISLSLADFLNRIIY